MRRLVPLLLVLTACAKKEDHAAAYVNPVLCTGCHAEIAASYKKTGMARAFAKASPANVVLHASSGAYRVVAREGRFFMQRDDFEKEIHYVVGSGKLAKTYLHRTRENKLIELPLSWYSESGGTYAMSPGFDRPGHAGFRRAISAECIFCHNGYPTDFVERRGEDAVFPTVLPEGIDCQRCHGPGSEHVRAAGKGAIVNPAKLTPERQLDVCMQCHLETTSSPLPDAMVRFGRGPFSYRPGEPLGDFKVYFDHAPGAGHEEKFEIVSAAYRLRQSRCFASGKLQCTTCHDPHGGASKRPSCAGCHGALPAEHPKGEDCAGCHMPKRRTEDVVHVVVTDHRIQRRPAKNLTAPSRQTHAREGYRGEVVQYYPSVRNEVMLAVAQVVQRANVQTLDPSLQPSEAEYYLVMADAFRKPELYDEALRRDPGLLAALLRKGVAARSEEVLREVTKKAPDRAAGWYELGLVLAEKGDRAGARAALERSLSIDDDHVEAHMAMAGLALSAGDPPSAEKSMRTAVRIQPESALVRSRFGDLLAAKGDAPAAMTEFTEAIRLQPELAPAHYGMALVLARQRRFAEAEREALLAVKFDPSHAGAFQVLGALLAGRGRKEEAIAAYRNALRLKPDFARAKEGLSLLLGPGNP